MAKCQPKKKTEKSNDQIFHVSGSFRLRGPSEDLCTILCTIIIIIAIKSPYNSY